MKEFDSIYREYFKDIYLYLRSLSGEEALAEELTAETFFKALKSIDSFRGDCNIRVWLCQIAKNTYYTYCKKKGKTENLTEEQMESRIDPPVEQRSPETVLIDKDISERLHVLLHRMEEPYKEVFSLRVFGELSFKQIGSLFGRTENWACVVYHRARKRLLEGLEEKER